MGARNVVITISRTKLAPTTAAEEAVHGSVQVMDAEEPVRAVDEVLTGDAERDVA